MTRRGVRSLDPEAEQAIESLPQNARDVLDILRVRMLIAPNVFAFLGKEPWPLTKHEQESLDLLDQALKQKESR